MFHLSKFVAEQIALIEHADALLISTRMNICGKKELKNLLSQLDNYREKIGGIIATACTKKNTSFNSSKYGNYYDSYHKESGIHTLVSSNKVATSVYKRELKNRRKYIHLRDED